MNSTDLKALLLDYKTNIETAQAIVTQYPNSKIDIDKDAIYAEIFLTDEIRQKDGTSLDSGTTYIHYNETGEINFLLYDKRGEGEKDIREKVDFIKDYYTDKTLGAIEFYEARSITLSASDEEWIIQVSVPFETNYKK